MSDPKTNEHKTPNSGAGKGFLMMIPIILLGIIIIKFLLLPGESKEVKSSNVDNNNNKTTVTQYTKTILVNYGPEYGKKISIPYGFDGYFDGATEDYCCCNKNGQEFCALKGEDVNMGDSEANSSLRFRSQNGNTGKLTIVLIKK